MDLARLHTAAMYAAEDPSTDDAEIAWQRFDEIDAALRKSVKPTARWKTRLRLRRPERAARESEPEDATDADPVLS
jgi:hypothetical protein